MGRPLSQYVERTAELEETILRRLSRGEPLERICAEEGMPTSRAVRKWVAADEEFAKLYQEARDDGFDAIAAECLDIADDARNDFMENQKDGTFAFNPEAVQRSKLRIWTRLELLKKWDPKRYADSVKADLNHVGQVGFSLTIVPRKKD